MTPLGQQIARLLQPEHWDEWDADIFTIRHRPTGVELWMGTDRFFFRVYEPHVEFRVWERLRLAKMARRVLRHIRGEGGSQAERQLLERLQTPEERAIEELLRS